MTDPTRRRTFAGPRPPGDPGGESEPPRRVELKRGFSAATIARISVGMPRLRPLRDGDLDAGPAPDGPTSGVTPPDSGVAGCSVSEPRAPAPGSPIVHWGHWALEPGAGVYSAASAGLGPGEGAAARREVRPPAA